MSDVKDAVFLMNNDEELTKVEIMIMKIIWSTSEEMMMGQILEKMNQQMKKPWKPQTMTSYLQRLVKKKFIMMKRQGRSYVYEVLVREEEFRQKEMARFTDTWGDHSPAGFVAAFSKDHPLTPEQKEELRSLIDDFD